VTALAQIALELFPAERRSNRLRTRRRRSPDRGICNPLAFHRFRHTCGTVMKRKGASDSQIQLWLGHHDPGFTARTYIHLDSRDLPGPTLFDSFLAPERGNKGATRPTETDQDQDAEEAVR
jgi:integrase